MYLLQDYTEKALAKKIVLLQSLLQLLATNLRRDTEQQNDSLNAKKSVIPAGMPESSHTDVKL